MTVDVGRGQLKRVLDVIAKSVQEMNHITKSTMIEGLKSTLNEASFDTHSRFRNLDIVVSGPTIDLLIKDPYLLEHFKFILEFTKTVIGYDFNSIQKKHLIALYNQLGRQTMAVGDGYNDIAMS